MAVTEIPWNDGTSDKLYFSAPASEGNQTVEISSDANAGASERTKTVNFSALGVSPQPLAIVQLAAGGADPDAWLKDGDTHLWINILDDYQMEQQIRIRMIGTIDWGDGTTKDTVSVTTYTTFTHTYAETGKYRIDLHPTSGTFYIGQSTSYNVMGERANATHYRTGALYQAELGSSFLTRTETGAFYCCYGLQRIYISKNVVTLGSNVFANCYGLNEVVYEDDTKVTTDTAACFNNCYNLKNIPSFINSTKNSENSQARGCYSLSEYTITPLVTSLAANSLHSMYSLKVLKCLPTSPPTVAAANVFTSFPTTCAIKVPIGSLSTYQSAGIWSTYSNQMSEAGLITFSLTRVSSSNKDPMTAKNGSYTTTLTADDGYTLGTVTVKMGGTDITSTAYSAGVVTIASVTGNITITATAS